MLVRALTINDDINTRRRKLFYAVHEIPKCLLDRRLTRQKPSFEEGETYKGVVPSPAKKSFRKKSIPAN